LHSTRSDQSRASRLPRPPIPYGQRHLARITDGVAARISADPSDAMESPLSTFLSAPRVNALDAPSAPAWPPSSRLAHDLSPADGSIPFADAVEAWFWTMRALVARRDGARRLGDGDDVRRPCVPDDVIKALDTLYRRRRIDLVHARVLRIWGERQQEPDPTRHRGDWANWREAMTRLAFPLRERGIVR
jgi:hypothetical protein